MDSMACSLDPWPEHFRIAKDYGLHQATVLFGRSFDARVLLCRLESVSRKWYGEYRIRSEAFHTVCFSSTSMARLVLIYELRK